MKKQYIIRKYVMASNVKEAIRLDKISPIHEVYVDSVWLEKVSGNEFYPKQEKKLGFKDKQ